MSNSKNIREIVHKADFCVVGGGLAGMLAAIAAARKGTKVVLMHDRPVLGGNASSEIRMWVRGAHGENNRETGILEEIELENMYRNPYRNYSIWDSILYEKVRFEPNITLLLNCSCTDAEVEDNCIKKVKGWQLTTYTWHIVEAKYFADCSGDSILAPLTGAEYRMGREGRDEFNESIAPAQADSKTMGLSCLIQARETNQPSEYIAPEWAYKYPNEDCFPHRGHDLKNPETNFWWIELGGEQHTINDTEEIRDELLKIAFGSWDHIKNTGNHDAENWQLDWVGFLPGKRESRRYVGDYILTQNDIESEGKFDDLVAYGGWTMDDHHPAGFNHPGHPTIWHPAPSPYGIPYRCLYSKNINNLFFAGRNISATHTALASTRVMGTCSMLGQAIGLAAAIATKYSMSPRQIYQEKIDELKQLIMEDDCYLPWNKRKMPEMTMKAELTASEGDPEPLRNGLDRPIGDCDNGWFGNLGSWVEYKLESPQTIHLLRFVFDSDLNRQTCPKDERVFGTGGNLCNIPLNMKPFGMPASLIKAFRIEVMDTEGNWKVVHQTKNNHKRLVYVPLNLTTKAVRFIPEENWGADKAHVFSFDIR